MACLTLSSLKPSSIYGLVRSQPSLSIALRDGVSRRSCSLPTTKHATSMNSQQQHGPARLGCTVDAAAATTPLQRESNPEALVDALLSIVEGTDRGALLGDDERGKAEELIAILEQHCMPEPLQSPLLFGEWDVVYSSNPTATGGYYRSAVGRALLRTKQMMQTVRAPKFVGNKVSFAALGLLDGEVSLKGNLEALDSRWIKVTFDSPYLKLGPFEFQYGETTSVKIAIIYLDERIRLGRGSRGSLFVFRRHC